MPSTRYHCCGAIVFEDEEPGRSYFVDVGNREITHCPQCGGELCPSELLTSEELQVAADGESTVDEESAIAALVGKAIIWRKMAEGPYTGQESRHHAAQMARQAEERLSRLTHEQIQGGVVGALVVGDGYALDVWRSAREIRQCREDDSPNTSDTHSYENPGAYEDY